MRSAAGDNTEFNGDYFCQEKTRYWITKCRRTLYLKTAHMKVEQVEKRFFCFSTQDEKKKKGISRFMSKYCFNVQYCIFVVLFSCCVGVFVVGGLVC